MRVIKAIIWKELHSFVRKRQQFGLLLLVFLFIGVASSFWFKKTAFLITPLASVFGGVYVLSWISFNGERINNTLSTLFASSITVGQFLLGKSIAIFIGAYLLELIALGISTLMMWFRMGQYPQAALLMRALITIPIWGIVITELLGLAYALWGNPFLIRLVGIVIMVAIINPGLVEQISNFSVPSIITIASGFGVALLLYFLIRRIDKGRILRV